MRKTSDVAEGKFVEEDPPRAYSQFPFDLDQEIRGAITIAEEYAPEGKRGTLYLWSGGAEPFEGAIARTRRLGLRNLNGGDSRFDADYPSISYLSAISRVAGAERQIYAANANDFIYTTDGGGRDHGFLHLEATIKSTENPRRLKPINVYYHMFAGEKTAQLEGVRLPSRRCPAGARDAGRGVALRGDRGRILRHADLVARRTDLDGAEPRRTADGALRRRRRSLGRFRAAASA